MVSLQTASLNEIRNAAARICGDHLKGRWKEVSAHELRVKPLSGGLSNFLYYIALPECDDEERRKSLLPSREPKHVVFRIHGQSHGEDALEVMLKESVVFALLSERNIGPKLYGIFTGGRLEQYVPARVLTTMELSDQRISKKIAEKMSETHALNMPISKEPDWIWNCMERWLSSVNNTLKCDIYTKRADSETVCTFDFAAEWQWLKSVIEEGSFPVVFCHNDIQEGNILFIRDCSADFEESSRRKRAQLNVSQATNIDKEIAKTRDSALSVTSSSYATADEDCEQDKEPNLMIIDFEYCAYNYRGFDLANHFLEWTFDYTNPVTPFYHHLEEHYPTEKQRRLFIASYLCKSNVSVTAYEPTAEEIENIQYEVRVCSMLSHIFWSLWSIANLSSNIEFGYWEYAVSRIQEYKRLKQAFIDSP